MKRHAQTRQAEQFGQPKTRGDSIGKAVRKVRNTTEDVPDVSSGWINEVDRIIDNIPVEVRVAALKANWILGRPSSGLRVVVSGAEANQLGLRIIEAAGETERLEAWVGVLQDVAEFVVVEALGDRAIAAVDDQTRAAEVIADDAVADAVLRPCSQARSIGSRRRTC